jgi:geranylgeranyl reductase family protein
VTPPWDVVVVGAGPAGAAAALGALRADPGLRVLVVDRARFPREKSCGDGIAPQVFAELAEVGVHDVASGWRPVRDLHLVRGPVCARGRLADTARVIPRDVFDLRLLEHARGAGAVVLQERVRDVGPAGPEVTVGGHRARVVIGADGAYSVVAGALRAGSRNPRAARRHAVAIRGYAPTPPHRAGSQVIVFNQARQPSYAWAFDRGDGLSNVGYGEPLRRDRPAARAAMLAELDRLVPGAATDGGSWRAHHLPLSGVRWRVPDGPVLLAGDAAGLVNPMTGEGIYYAVATGVRAGRAAAAALAADRPDTAGARYRRAAHTLLAAHLRHTWAAAGLAARPAVVETALAAAGTDPRVFGDLVELGLGRGRVTGRTLRALTGTALRHGLTSHPMSRG